MRLSVYLKENRLSDADFAAIVGSTSFAVGKWRRGERTPRDAAMRQIVVATGGAVTPNDFFSAGQASKPREVA